MNLELFLSGLLRFSSRLIPTCAIPCLQRSWYRD